MNSNVNVVVMNVVNVYAKGDYLSSFDTFFFMFIKSSQVIVIYMYFRYSNMELNEAFMFIYTTGQW